jgi:hypothetical protein
MHHLDRMIAKVLPTITLAQNLQAVFRWWCKIFGSTITLSFLFDN